MLFPRHNEILQPNQTVFPCSVSLNFSAKSHTYCTGQSCVVRFLVFFSKLSKNLAVLSRLVLLIDWRGKPSCVQQEQKSKGFCLKGFFCPRVMGCGKGDCVCVWEDLLLKSNTLYNSSWVKYVWCAIKSHCATGRMGAFIRRETVWEIVG